MYNEVYIKDYDETMYLDHLRSLEKLKRLKEEYLKQYKDQSNASALAFKESLDHYVKKRLIQDPSFINSQEFTNYLQYIFSIVDEKKWKLKDNYYIYPELVTNIVFRDNQLRERIFQTRLKTGYRENYEKKHKFTKEALDEVFNAIESKKRIPQHIIDMAGDYIYSSRDLSNNREKIFAEYILNESKKHNIKSSPQIIGGMLTIFTNNYTIDDEIKNSRFFIASLDNGKKFSTAHSSYDKRYCVFQKETIDQVLLTSDQSLLKSRTNKEIDLYWIMMVAFHELTHQHQKIETEKERLSSSSLSYIINRVLINLMPTVIHNNKVVNDYDVNHDSDEIEMDADEEAWRQVRHFCHTFVDNKNNRIIDQNGKDQSKWIIALENERIIQARRVFSLKKDVNIAYQEKDLPKEKKTPGIYYALYDMLNLEKGVKKDPQIREKYPLLKRFFDENGKMKSLDILKMDIYKNDQEDTISRNSSNNAGLEIGTHVLYYKWNDVMREIESKKITSKEEAQTIRRNIFRIIHDSVEKARIFDEIIFDGKNRSHIKIDPTQYDETNIRYNLDNESYRKATYEHFFKNVVIGAQRYYEYRRMMKWKYNIEFDDHHYERDFLQYIYQLYQRLIDKDNISCLNALEQLNTSGDLALINIYNTMMNIRKQEKLEKQSQKS